MIRKTAKTVQPLTGEPACGSSDLLAIGFGTAVAMWAVGYVGHMPLTDVPPAIFVSLMLVCLAAGGWVAGRQTGRGVSGGLGVGLIVALLNLLILGSVLAPTSGQIVPQAWLWVPGYFVLCAAVAAIGSWLGAGSREHKARNTEYGPPNWTAGFAWIACVATLLLISIGGLVTGFRAGMAVPDWPNTYHSNMFLYPLGKMTGGVFYEHAHRLLGSLVGLTTFTLAVLLTVQRRSIGLILLIWTVGSCVAVQGILGGFRVTENNIDLAVVHGFFAHVVLAGMVAVAALLARRPTIVTRSVSEAIPTRSVSEVIEARSASEREGNFLADASSYDEYGRSESLQAAPNLTDCLFSTVLVLGVMLQTLLGCFVRQKGVCLLEHICVALFVIIFAIVVGVRLWGLYPHIRVFARGGVALVAVVIVQLFLGGISLAAQTPPAVQSPSAAQLEAHAPLQPALHAIITTLHQTTAAVILGLATLLAVLCWRLVAAGRAKEEAIDADACRA